MTELVPCPTCQTMNRPTQRRCRACGRTLKPAKDSSPSVGLQRVMGGELFTAVVGREASAPPADASVPNEAEAVRAKEDDGDATQRLLMTVSDRLRERATSSGQRFKPYVASRPRVSERPEDRVTVTRQLESAARAFREKHYETAVEHLLKAIAKDDGDARSWALLGQAYLRCDRPYKAAVGYLRALELEPRNASAWLGLARVLKGLGDLEAAREVLDGTVRASPDLTEAWAERGQVLEALNDRAEAAKSFAKALELKPDHRTARERYEKLAPPEPAPEPTPSPVLPNPATAPEAEEEFPDFADLAELPRKAVPEAPAEEPPEGRPARVPTYVEGLDEALGGGIPWGYVVLIEGSPGSMKSSLGFSILLQNAARDARHCLYLSLKERTSILLRQMGSLGLRLQVNQGSLVVLDPRAARGLMQGRANWIDALRSAIATIQAQRGLDLIVIDSLDALEVLAATQDRRQEVYGLFEWLRDLDATSFVIAERPTDPADGLAVRAHRDEDFLADGILHLTQHPVSDSDVQRRLRIVKMRGTQHGLGSLSLVLDDGGFRVSRKLA